jgi:acyl carrier protein
LRIDPLLENFIMTTGRETLTTTVMTLLQAIAPELEPDTLNPARPLRSQVDLDSMDWLNFLVSLSERFGVVIPEAEYARLVSFNDVLDYLAGKSG